MWIIVEEYEPDHIEETLTNILPYYYEDEIAALTALREIAADFMLDPESVTTKFEAVPEDGIHRDTYYIKELQRG